uniref:JmjC domain-containing protein n=1 Tax=Noctiluca scintillans TaxID=2966 RepID=A0A7S1A3A4_NOCSC
MPHPHVLRDVPCLDGPVTSEEVTWALSVHRLLLVPSPTVAPPGCRDVLCRFVSARRSKVLESWTAESVGSTADLLATSNESWYGSFVLEGLVSHELLQELPPSTLLSFPVPGAWPTGATWVFFGQNVGGEPFVGKPEHTDDVRPGIITMHTQLCGEKLWRFRPNLSADWSESGGPPCILGALEVRCRAGDRLLVDTWAWYHETRLPPLPSFSLSVARDFCSSANVPVKSRQVYVVKQVCGKCGTFTSTPRGAPAGTCGCACCCKRREERWEWDLFRRSTALAQWEFAAQLCSMLSRPTGQRAILDR